MLRAWKDLWSEELLAELSDTSPEALEGKAIASDPESFRNQLGGPIFALLKQGEAVLDLPRSQTIGIASIYIGWANDPETSNQLHDILLHRANTLPQTKGDALVLLLTDEILPVIEPPSEFNDENLTLWEEVAKGSNPIYRGAAAKLFPKITSDAGRAVSFYSNYYGETDATIKREVLRQMDVIPIEKRLDCLVEFASAQKALGDQEFYEEISEHLKVTR